MLYPLSYEGGEGEAIEPADQPAGRFDGAGARGMLDVGLALSSAR
jgi:hypothetical protein